MSKHISGSKAFYRAHCTELQGFLYHAQVNGYGNPNIIPITKDDGSFSTPPYEEGPWRYVDTWCGGEPFAGMSTVWYKGVVCWNMVYWGRIMPIPGLDYHWITSFLSEALQHIDPEHPWRGPTHYPSTKEGEQIEYRKAHNGSVRRFSGQEAILRPKFITQWPDKKVRSDEILYEAFFYGGIVNRDLTVGKPATQAKANAGASTTIPPTQPTSTANEPQNQPTAASAEIPEPTDS